MQININIKQKETNKIKMHNISLNSKEDKKISLKIDKGVTLGSKEDKYYYAITINNDPEIILRSLDKMAYNAEMYQITTDKWVPCAVLWHNCIDMGVEDLDYKYINNNEVENYIEKAKRGD